MKTTLMNNLTGVRGSVFLLCLACVLTSRAQELLVTSHGNDSVRRYDGVTGTFLGVFVTDGSGGLDQPRIARFGPNGNLFVPSLATSSVLEYAGSSGAFLGEFVSSGSGGLVSPWALAWGPNGNLFVTSHANEGCVLEYDGTTGAFVGTFACLAGYGGSAPQGLLFSPNGHLYVSFFAAMRVIEYNPDGNVVHEFIGGGLSGPRGLTFAPNGNLLVVSIGNDKVVEFDIQNGQLVGDFVSSGSGGLDAPQDLAFKADGNLLVTSANTDEVLEYDGVTGQFLGEFISSGSGGLDAPIGLAWRPPEGLAVPADFPDGPDEMLACFNSESCNQVGHFPSLLGSVNGMTPYHTMVDDAWPGPLPNTETVEANAFQTCCSWVWGTPDCDDGMLVLILDDNWTTGVKRSNPGECPEVIDDPFGLNPTNQGFWVFEVSVHPSAPSVPRYVNVVVDWDLSGHYGDAPGEWVLIDEPLGGGGTQTMVTDTFPVLTIQPCGNVLGWCILPFWTRTTVSRTPLTPFYAPNQWDGSCPLPTPPSFIFGATEDTVVFTDPGAPGDSCADNGCVGAHACNFKKLICRSAGAKLISKGAGTIGDRVCVQDGDGNFMGCARVNERGKWKNVERNVGGGSHTRQACGRIATVQCL